MLKARFKQQKEVNIEELSHLFSIKVDLGRYMYKIMESLPGNVIKILEKLIAEFITKQETQKLINAFEFMRIFIEVDEKSGGSVMKDVKDTSFKILLKGALPNVANKITQKTSKLLNKLIKGQ